MGLDAVTIFKNLYGSSGVPQVEDLAYIPLTDTADQSAHLAVAAWVKEEPKASAFLGHDKRLQSKLPPPPAISLSANNSLGVRMDGHVTYVSAQDVEATLTAHQNAPRSNPSDPWIEKSHFWGLVVETAKHKEAQELERRQKSAQERPMAMSPKFGADKKPSPVKEITVHDDHMISGNPFDKQVDAAIEAIQRAVQQNRTMFLFAPDQHYYKLEISDTAPSQVQITNPWSADATEQAQPLEPSDLRSLIRDGSKIEITRASVTITDPRPPRIQ